MKFKLSHYSYLHGIAFMLINTMCLTGIDALIKILTSSLTPSLIVFLYKATSLLIALPWLFSKGITVLKTNKLIFHIFRSIFSVAGSICFFNGLQYVNMADAAALENIQYLIISIIGMLFFNEECTKERIIAVIVGLLGAFIIINPDILSIEQSYSYYNSGHIYILAAMCFWALNTITVKVLGITENNKTQMFYLLLFSTTIAGCSAFVKFSTTQVFGLNLSVPALISFPEAIIEWWHIKFLIVLALFYFIHGIAYFNALKSDLSIVVPFRYTKLIFSGILSYLLFADLPEYKSYIGYVLIITASFILLYSEAKKKRLAQVNA